MVKTLMIYPAWGDVLVATISKGIGKSTQNVEVNDGISGNNALNAIVTLNSILSAGRVNKVYMPTDAAVRCRMTMGRIKRNEDAVNDADAERAAKFFGKFAGEYLNACRELAENLKDSGVRVLELDNLEYVKFVGKTPKIGSTVIIEQNGRAVSGKSVFTISGTLPQGEYTVEEKTIRGKKEPVIAVPKNNENTFFKDVLLKAQQGQVANDDDQEAQA